MARTRLHERGSSDAHPLGGLSGRAGPATAGPRATAAPPTGPPLDRHQSWRKDAGSASRNRDQLNRQLERRSTHRRPSRDEAPGRNPRTARDPSRSESGTKNGPGSACEARARARRRHRTRPVEARHSADNRIGRAERKRPAEAPRSTERGQRDRPSQRPFDRRRRGTTSRQAPTDARDQARAHHRDAIGPPAPRGPSSRWTRNSGTGNGPPRRRGTD